MVNDAEIQKLLQEHQALETQYKVAKDNGRAVLADALELAIKSLDYEIQAGG